MLGSLIASFAAGEAVLAVKAWTRNAITCLIAALLAAVGIIYLLVAAFIGLERHFDAVYVALGFAAGFFVLALVVYFGRRMGAAARNRAARERRETELKAAAIPAALSMLPGLARSRGGIGALALAAAAVAAFAIYRENGGWRRGGDGKS